MRTYDRAVRGNVDFEIVRFAQHLKLSWLSVGSADTGVTRAKVDAGSMLLAIAGVVGPGLDAVVGTVSCRGVFKTVCVTGKADLTVSTNHAGGFYAPNIPLSL